MSRPRRFVRTARVGAWIALGRENVVRLVDFDDLLWGLDVDFFRYDIAYCRSGGLLALYHRNVSSSGSRGSVIKLYNANGTPHPLSPQIYLDDMTNLMFACWDYPKDNLIVVSNSGTLRFFNFRGEPIGSSLRVPVPSLCTSTEAGVALLVGLQELRLVLVESGSTEGYEAVSISIPRLLHDNKPCSMLAVPPRFSDSGHTEIFVPFVTTENASTVYHIVFHEKYMCHDLGVYIEGGNFVHMALSPNGRSVAFMVRDGTVYVASRSFDDITRLLNINTDVIPSQFMWCGDRCISYLHRNKQFDAALNFPTTLSLLSVDDPDKSDYLNDIPVDAHLVPECDGVRILSARSYQFLQVVPEPVRRIFSVGSRAKSAMLLSAYDEFMCGNANSVKIIRDLQRDKHGLSEAVDDCIAAAKFELSVSQQKRLMRVAAFGKSFCAMYESDVFVDVIRHLRAVNMLCKSKAGTLLSQAQLSELKEKLVRRLALLNYHQLAYHVCELLGFSAKDVMMEWAMLMLTNSSVSQADEGRLVSRVVDKLKCCKQSAYCEIALKLYRSQRVSAALAVLEAETSVSERISHLLQINQLEEGLRQAIRSGDTGLIFTVIKYLISSESSDALTLLKKFVTSRRMLFVFAKSARVTNSKVMEIFKTYPDECAYLDLLRYLEEVRVSTGKRGEGGQSCEDLLVIKLNIVRSTLLSCPMGTVNIPSKGGLSGNTYSHSLLSGSFRPPSDSEKWLRLHMDLMEEQKNLVKKLKDRRFLDASVTKTITLCHEHGCKDVADRIKNKFGVSDKMNTWCMVKAAVETKQWNLVDEISDIRGKGRSPVSGFAFVRALFANCQRQQAKQYIPKIPQIEWRMEYYVLCGDWKTAGADCRRHSEPELLRQLKDRAKGDTDALRQIEEGWNSVQESGAVRLAKLFG